jgi:hypothetical protein
MDGNEMEAIQAVFEVLFYAVWWHICVLSALFP